MTKEVVFILAGCVYFLIAIGYGASIYEWTGRKVPVEYRMSRVLVAVLMGACWFGLWLVGVGIRAGEVKAEATTNITVNVPSNADPD